MEDEKNIERLAKRFHEIYQTEAKRQGDTRHPDAYEDLPENIKNYDRALARYIYRLYRFIRVKMLRAVDQSKSNVSSTVSTRRIRIHINEIFSKPVDLIEQEEVTRGY